MACGSRLPQEPRWLRDAVLGYIDEEQGHEEWVLNDIEACGADAWAINADLSGNAGRRSLLSEVHKTLGGVDLLINAAGVVDFHDFSDQDPAMIEHMLQTNLIAPVQLTRAVLPDMIRQGQGRIVNIGSTFGSIGFAYFAAYSSSKFALRGFSEALRRELYGTGVGVTYIAPRAVRTPANSKAVYEMAEAARMNLDEPQAVAEYVVRCIRKDKALSYLQKALAINPQGIAPNYFYGDYMLEEGEYQKAAAALENALSAPPRPDRPLADAGRRQEVKTALAKAKAHLR